MGLVRKPTFAEYWSTRGSQSTPWFRKMFPRNRFQIILKFFHVVDNRKVPKRNSPQYRPDSKFKPLLDYANTMFTRYYQPQKDICVDETLVGTRGRTAMLQYIPSKHSKFGVKFWVLAESATGYIVRMSCYLGKKFQPVTSGVCQGTSVVLDLLRESELLGRGYHVFCDNFFTSVELAKALLRMGTFLTGTIRSNRRIPSTIKEANVLPGNTIFMRQGRILLAAHKGMERKRPVRLLSTAIPSDLSRGVPAIVSAYNKNMGGVDGADMQFSFYSNMRKSLKVWKKMAFHILQRMLLNSYVLYKSNTSEKAMSRLQFIQEVIEGLALRHLNELDCPTIPVQPRQTQKDCSVCSNRALGIRRRSRMVCQKCRKGVHISCKRQHKCSEE